MTDRLPIPAALLASMSEAELQRLVVDAAALGGWAVAHFPPSRSHRGGHLTAGAYDTARGGWPDLVLVRDRLLVLELKSARGRITDAQRWWIDRFDAAGVAVRVVRPADADALIAELTARPRRRGDPWRHADRVEARLEAALDALKIIAESVDGIPAGIAANALEAAAEADR